jgi:hypothetical protein
MFGPSYRAACPGCTELADHFDAALAHLNHRDVTLLAISRAPLKKPQTYKRRMDWQFPYVSSFRSDFNFDFGFAHTEEEMATGQLVAVEKHEPKGLGRARLERIADVSADTLTGFVQRNVAPSFPDEHDRLCETILETDGWHGYDRLAAAGYRHEQISLNQTRDRKARTASCPPATGSPRCSSAGCSEPTRRRQPRTARRLPRRVRVPLQPPILAQHRPALPPPAHKHAADPAEPVQDPHRHADRATPRLASRCVKGIAHWLDY